MILEESLKLMQEDRMSEFGQAVILYLVNHAKLDQTRMSPTAKRLFFSKCQSLMPLNDYAIKSTVSVCYV